MMGVIYSIACKDCKIVRDLDKFYAARSIESRAEAIEYGKEIAEHEGTCFRAALLVSFMAEHEGHDCVFFHEGMTCEEDLEPFYDSNDFKEDFDYWKTVKI